MKQKKSKKAKTTFHLRKKAQPVPEKDTQEETAEKARLIRAWLRKGNKIKKIPPAFIP